MRDFSVGDLITSYRTRLGKLQKEVANPDDPNLLPVTLRTYQGWENGERIPSNKWLYRLASFFHLTEDEANELYRAAAQVPPKIENLPFQRNPFFTGRETYLERLDQHFKENGNTALTQPISISGLGGIGKTQLALEYAHRNHPHVYRAVFWANAANKAALEASYLSLAQLLNLPEKDKSAVDLIIQAMKVWLKEHTNWLLILDNVDDVQLARSFLPATYSGHVLLTTRSPIIGNIAMQIEMEAMDPKEGLPFLLLRSALLKDKTKLDALAFAIRNAAEQLVKLLGGHPLALDQAGAYIEETRKSCIDYMQLYHEERRFFLSRRGSLEGEHPEAVFVTFEISLKKACELYPVAADVLQMCAFLEPDAIPEELFHQEHGLKLDVISFDEAIAALRRYSLIKRDGQEKMLVIHRLVQAVLIDSMSTETIRQWKERIIQALNKAFPHVTFEEWTSCRRLLPHVLICTTWKEQEAILPLATVHLLRKAGTYLRERGQYAEAETLYLHSLSICEQYLGTELLDTAMILHSLAVLYWHQGRYMQEEPLLQRALSIRKQQLGSKHPDTARTLTALALVYWQQKKYEQAKRSFQQALSIRKQQLGTEHLDTARSMYGLAMVYRDEEKYKEAELLFQHVLSISERYSGAKHPDTAWSLYGLGSAYLKQGYYEQAKPLFQRACSIYEQDVNVEQHPDMVYSLYGLAELYRLQEKYEQAEPLYLQALSICEQHLGANHPYTAYPLYGLAALYQSQGKLEQAEPLFQRALAISQQPSRPTPLNKTFLHII
jgi:tetratricopeptide (TPR) repeat protein